MNLQKEVAELGGYVTSSANFSAISAGIRGELTPVQKRRQSAASESNELGATKLAKPQQNAPKRTLEAPTPYVTFPPIKETEYRGQHRTSYSFIGPDDFSIFTYDSFKEARAEREKMRPLYLQTAIYENTHRQSTAARRASAASEDDEE